MRSVFILVASLAASALAGPTGQRSTCAVQCNDESIFSYQQGKSYVYQYDVTTSTALLATLHDHADVHITTTAHIDVVSPCEYTLRLTEVQLEGSTKGQEFAAAVTKSPLRFSFQDGRVEAVCSEVSEPVWVLNFKRGVLSTFQSTMTHPGHHQDVQETDISGTCMTHYKRTMEGSVISIDKVKDLSSCTQRPDLSAYIASTAYVSDSPVQSLPIFNSISNCHQIIEQGILKTAECHESHKFRPFSSEEGGAITTVKTTMVLVSQDQTTVPTPNYEFIRKSPVFEETTTASPQAQIEAANQILADLDQAAHGEIRPSVPALFSKLVASLKSLDYETLATLYTNTRETHSRKFLVDAMPLVGSAAAMGVVKDMFINGDITQVEADTWFTSLAFFKNPTSDMFTAIASLLDISSSKSAMLGSSALLNTYCKLNTDCSVEPGVQQVLRFIESQLASGCRTFNDEEKMKVLVALKALGNAGRWVNANRVLQRCYTEENDMEVRVAAIEAWRHTPCEYDRSNLLTAFQDDTQDTEIRIAAYLAVMTCPTEAVVLTIKDRLTSEAVNQVGSFVWTHLTNMQESAAPGKQWFRDMIGEELLQNKFNTQALKFSRNYESSFFTNELNAGAAVESNVIFSSKSYLPRSAMLNLTLDLFGESINLFEVGGRIQGFESYIERFFGPTGYFPHEIVEGVLKNLHQNKPDSEETTLEGLLDKATDEPEGSYYLRVFGKELHYNHFHGLDNIFQISNPLDLIMELVRKGDIDYTKSFQLMDAHYSIPTMSGFPVILNAKGTATLALRMNGNLNANSFTNFNIEGHLHPSAAIQMDGVMMVDAHVTRKGLKISSTLHTSTLIDGKIHINGGKLVDVAINTPKEKIEVIDVDTKFFIMEDDNLVEKQPENEQITSCTRGESGMQLCKETNYIIDSDTNWQAYGGRIYLSKTDTQTGYILKYTKNNNEVSFLLDTPGSERDHRIFFDIKKSDQTFNFNIATPWKSVEGNAEYQWQANKKNLEVDITVDGSQTYALKTQLLCSHGEEVEVEQTLVLSSPQGEMINTKGFFHYIPAEKKYLVDIAVSKLLETPLVFQASYEQGERSAKANLAVKSPLLNINIDELMEYDDTSISTSTDIAYHDRNSRHTIQYTALIKQEVSDEVTTTKVKVVLQPTTWTPHPITFDYQLMMSEGRLECTGKFVLDEQVTWNLEEIWTYTRNEDRLILSNHVQITCPAYDFDRSSSNELRLTHNEAYVSIKSIVGSELDGEITAELKRNEDREIIGRMVVNLSSSDVSFDALYTNIADGHYKAQIIRKYKNIEEQTIVIEGSVIDNSTPGKGDVKIEGALKSPFKNIKVNAEIFGSEERAKVELRTKVDDEVEYNLLMEGTHNSILVDTNIYKHILINAHVNADESGMKIFTSVEWDKDADPTKSIEIQGKLTLWAAEAGMKFLGREVFVNGHIGDDGMVLQGQWSPNKRVKIDIHFDFQDKHTVSATLETPFSGWEKQNATFTVSATKKEVNARVIANWKNSQQMTLTISANLLPGFAVSALFSSTFTAFERLTFILDHKMAAATIHTNMEATWNDKKINGAININPTENGIDGSATFTSPFTQEALMTLHHDLSGNQLSTSLEAKYGTHVSTITLNGHIILDQTHDVALEFKVLIPLESVPEMGANFKYSLNNGVLGLIIDGNAGDKKMMLNVNGEKTVSESMTAMTGELRFITPFIYPLTASMSHNHDGQQFKSQFEMSRVWSSYGSIKFHANGHFISRNDIELSATLNSPIIKGAFSLVHKIRNNHLTSEVKANINGERIIVSLNGTLDEALHVANLEGEVSSTFNGLDDIKIKISSHKEGIGRTSRVIISKGTETVTIDHNISYSDMYNWDNIFKINNKFMLKNTQTHTGTTYGHAADVQWDEKTVSVKGSYDKKVSGSWNVLETQLNVATPWEYYENIKVNFNIQKSNEEVRTALALGYKPGSVIELKTSNKCLPDLIASEASLATPFWDTFRYSFTVEIPRKTLDLVLLHGQDETSINLGGNWQPRKIDGHLSITSAYVSTPILIEGLFDTTSPEKTYTVAVTTNEKYHITGHFSGDITNANLSFITKLPIEVFHDVEFKGGYQLASFPITLNTELRIDARHYQVNGQIETNAFQLEMNMDGQRGSVLSNWQYQTTKANAEITIQSPFTSFTGVGNMGATVMYDMEAEKKVNVKLNFNNKEITISGQLENTTLTIQGTTPFSGWETLNASFFISNTAVNVSVSQNDKKIEVTGTVHLRPQKGKGELTITTPFEGHETISLEALYNFHGDSKTVQLKSMSMYAEVSVKGAINLSNRQAPEMTLNIETPFHNVRSLRAKANWNVQNPIKTAEVKVSHGEDMYYWRLETTASSLLKGHVSSKISTPLAGWSDVSVKADFDFTSLPYTAAFEYEKEGLVKRYEGSVSVTQNAIRGTITTPITGWESVTLIGDYNYQQTHLTGNVEFNKGSEVYDVKGDILFNTESPKLKLEVKTPIPQFANIGLKMESNLVNIMKEFHIVFSNNDITYSADLTGQFARKVGTLKVIMKSPIPGFTDLQVDSEYDFTGDMKMAELNVKKEGLTKHFSLTSRINNNNIILDIITPFQDFEVMKLNADYSAQPGLHNVVATFVRDSNVYDFHTIVTLQDTSAEIKLSTPIEAIRNVVVSVKYEILVDGVIGSASFHRNDDIFEFITHYNFNPLVSHLMVDVKTPVTGWRKLGLTLNFDFISEKKVMEVAMQKGDILKKFAIEASYNIESGAVKLTTPIPGHEIMGAEYTLKVNSNNNKLEASLKVNHNAQEWSFSASGHYEANEILVKLQTPFPDFEIISIEGNISTDTKTGKGVVHIGSYTISVSASYAPDNMFLELATPYDPLRFFSVSFKYNLAPSQMGATLNVTHNNKTFVLLGALQVSPRTSELTLQATAPIRQLNNLAFQIKYDIDNIDQLVFVQMSAGEDLYKFSVGGHIEERVAILKWSLTTPYTGWTNVKFQTRIDLANEDKFLEISLERDGNVKEIAIRGKFIGGTVAFDLRTPFTGFQHLNAFGNLNRAKRSLEFQMMNDAGEASIAANFHSIKLHVKSPFERFEEITWEIKKESEGVYKAEWRRNDNFVVISIEQRGRSNAFDVAIKSELNGWEFLGLSGRIDTATYDAYLRGQRNERKVEISVNGTYDQNSNYNILIKTPYENYSEVTGTIRVNRRRNVLNVNINSSSSEFNINIKFKKSSGLQINLFVPNEQTPTTLVVQMNSSSGLIEFHSRFEILRSYKQEYTINLFPIHFTHTIEVNDVQIFSMVFMATPEENKIHYEVHIHQSGHHLTLHIHREGFTTATFLIKCEKEGSEKELKIEMKGEGDLPTHGTMHFDINNSFHARARHTIVHVEVDRRSERKHVKIDITLPRRKLYSINIDYNISLNDMSHGDFTIGITTPTRDNAIWKSVAGNWNVEDMNQTSITLTLGNLTYTANGKLGLRESNLILTAPGSNADIYLQWMFLREGDHRDYFLKVGRERKYGLLKFKGTITDYANGDVEAAFKAPAPFQDNEFHFTTKWEMQDDGSIAASGDFEHGHYRGTHHMQIQRNAAEKKGKLSFRVESNNPNYQLINLNANYDVNKKLKFNMELNVNHETSKIEIDISNFNPRRSRNTIEAHLPFLEEYANFTLTLVHNFENTNNKVFRAVAQVGNREAYVKANWKRSDSFDVLEGKINIKSINLGQISINGKYNVADFSNASAEVHYNRVTPAGEEKLGNIVWHRVRTRDHLETELLIDSTLDYLSHVRAFTNANFSQNFQLAAGFEWNAKVISVNFEIGNQSISGNISTPFEGFETITGLITYSLTGKDKSVTLKYERGEKKVNMTLTLTKKKNRRNFELNLTTPFEVLRELIVEGNWNKNRATVTYTRNGESVTLKGKAQLESSRSEIIFNFTTPQGKNIKIAAAYNVRDILRGGGTEPQKIASLEMEIEDLDINFTINGFRNDDRIFAEIDEHSSFLGINTYLKLDAEQNDHKQNGLFELRINDFVFNTENTFERYQNAEGYYFKSKIESSLTSLPALVFGLGCKNDGHIITLGYDVDKEITFSIKAKNNFKSGFSGFVDIPNFGYEGVKYEVDYSFPDDHTLIIELDVQLGRDGEEVEAHFQYDSDGVKARLSAPFMGGHSVRARRSISSDSFFTEIGYNDYNLLLRGGFENEDHKCGVVLEGEVFGRKFLIDYLFQSEGLQYSEGKLLIKTPFQGMENIGGLFKITSENKSFKAQAELLLPFVYVPKITIDADLDLNQKIEGHVTIDVSGQQFIVRSDLVGASLNRGYQGRVEIFTPFHALSHVSLEGNIKTNMYNHFKADFKINDSYTTHDFEIEYELAPNKLSVSSSLHSDSYSGVEFHFTLEGLEATHKKMEVHYNNDKLIVEYDMSNSVFTFNAYSLYNNVPHQFSINAQYASLRNLTGTLALSIREIKHKVHGEFNIAGNHVKGDLELESSLIEGDRKLMFDLLIPSKALEEGVFDFNLTTSVTHSFHLEFNTRTGVRVKVGLDTPTVHNFNAIFELSGATAGLTVETPTVTHKAKITWRTTAKMLADYIAIVELESPFLGQPWSLSVQVSDGGPKKVVKAELQTGDERYLMEGNAYVGVYAVGFSLNIETPFKNIEKAVLKADVDMGEKIKVRVIANLAEEENAFNFEYDREKNSFLALATSPYIPTGQVKAEATLTRNMSDLQFNMVIMNARDTFSVRFTLSNPDPNNITIKTEIATPIPELRSINYLCKYTKREYTNIIVSIDNPIPFRANAKFSNLDEEIKGNVKINTSVQDWEYMEATFDVPLAKFAPRATVTLPGHKYGMAARYEGDLYSHKASADLFLDDVVHGGNFNIRNKAPYELGFGLNNWRRFHLRTDSSFFFV